MLVDRICKLIMDLEDKLVCIGNIVIAGEISLAIIVCHKLISIFHNKRPYPLYFTAFCECEAHILWFYWYPRWMRAGTPTNARREVKLLAETLQSECYLSTLRLNYAK